MGLPYACLIYRLVIALGVSFPKGVPRRVSRPIGHATIAQSRSILLLSQHSLLTRLPADPIDDFISFDPLDFPTSSFAPPSSDIPLSSNFAPPPIESVPLVESIPLSVPILIDP